MNRPALVARRHLAAGPSNFLYVPAVKRYWNFSMLIPYLFVSCLSRVVMDLVLNIFQIKLESQKDGPATRDDGVQNLRRRPIPRFKCQCGRPVK